MAWWWGRGFGRFWYWWNPFTTALASRGYYYIGPCRCGFGPHAFYMTPTGQIVHAWQLYGIPYAPYPWTPLGFPGAAPMRPEDELRMLEDQKRSLERQLEEINKRLKELRGEG